MRRTSAPAQLLRLELKLPAADLSDAPGGAEQGLAALELLPCPRVAQPDRRDLAEGRGHGGVFVGEVAVFVGQPEQPRRLAIDHQRREHHVAQVAMPLGHEVHPGAVVEVVVVDRLAVVIALGPQATDRHRQRRVDGAGHSAGLEEEQLVLRAVGGEQRDVPADRAGDLAADVEDSARADGEVALLEDRLVRLEDRCSLALSPLETETSGGWVHRSPPVRGTLSELEGRAGADRACLECAASHLICRGPSKWCRVLDR